MTTAALVLSICVWSFAEEDVTMTVASQSFDLTATYTFRCSPGAADLPILYPFPPDASLGAPERIMVALLRDNGALDPIDVCVSPDGWRWIVPGGDVNVRRVRVVYRQAIRDRCATYVLSSTKRWLSPLERAQLTVEVPLGLDVSMTPKLQPLDVSGGLQVYGAEFRDWMPDSDLVVRIGGPRNSP